MVFCKIVGFILKIESLLKLNIPPLNNFIFIHHSHPVKGLQFLRLVSILQLCLLLFIELLIPRNCTHPLFYFAKIPLNGRLNWMWSDIYSIDFVVQGWYVEVIIFFNSVARIVDLINLKRHTGILTVISLLRLHSTIWFLISILVGLLRLYALVLLLLPLRYLFTHTFFNLIDIFADSFLELIDIFYELFLHILCVFVEICFHILDIWGKIIFLRSSYSYWWFIN